MKISLLFSLILTFRCSRYDSYIFSLDFTFTNI